MVSFDFLLFMCKTSDKFAFYSLCTSHHLCLGAGL